ncbi:MAG: glycosyltransferase [Fusicatenibacter sp.]|nr:glycosyltransferase [Fusicatenibacter sp.]
MMEKELISIVIPVFNVQDYVDDCLESVIYQTYQNLEIIVVDDGSTDQSGSKCDAWAKKDTRIRVIHKKNGGLSDARNAGLAYASGNYIGFVDGDDVVFPEMYRMLYESMIETSAQISCCKPQRGEHFSMQLLRNKNVYDPESGLEEIKSSWKIMTNHDAMHALVYEDNFSVTVWNKLYERSVLEGIIFEKGKYHEDEFWTYQVIEKANLIVLLDVELYGYRQRENSVMNQTYSLRHLDLLDARINRLLFIEQKYPELISAVKCNLRFECIRAFQLSALTMEGKMAKIARKKAHTVAKQYPIRYEDYRSLPIGRQIWCLMSRISFPLTCYIRNWLHYGP